MSAALLTDRPALRFTGFVDLITSRKITGWAAVEGHWETRPEAVATLHGRVIGRGRCDLFREDLQFSGVGDARHGFEIEIPATSLEAIESIKVAAHAEGQSGDLPGAEMDLTPLPGMVSPPSIQGPGESTTERVWFDVTDLVVFLGIHRNVTGIQRVQCGYLFGIIDQGCGERYRFCSRENSNAYYEVRPEILVELVRRSSDASIRSAHDWNIFAEQIKRRIRAKPVAFHHTDILCVVGAPWVVENHYPVVAKLKQEHGIRCFQLIYDIIPTVVPETCDNGVIDVFNRALTGALRYCDGLFSISDYSMRDLKRIAERVGQPLPPCPVIPMGSDIDFMADAATREAVPLSRRIAEVVSGPFVLVVGTIEPRKNHAYLFQVWKRIVAELGDRAPKLVCVGRQGWHVGDFMRQLEVTDHLDGMFLHFGDVNDEELQALYKSCLFTMFVSLYEGWGLPVAESLAHGKLCVASNATSMPEVGGEFALYVDPLNVAEGVNTVRRLLADPGLIQQYEMRIARDYRPKSWRVATEEFLEALNGLADVTRRSSGASEDQAVRLPTLSLPHVIDFGHSRRTGRPLDRIAAENRRLAAHELRVGNEWNDSEPWGCWSRGREAALAFKVKALAGAHLMIFLDVRVPDYFGRRSCAIRVNDKPFTQHVFERPQASVALKIPASLLAAQPDGSRLAVIYLELDATVSPAEAGVEDMRTLGIGLSAIRMCGSDDHDSRMDFLEESQMAVSRPLS